MSSPSNSTRPHDRRGRPRAEYLGFVALVAMIVIGAVLFMQSPQPR